MQMTREEVKEIIEGVMDAKLKDLKSDVKVMKEQNGEMWLLFTAGKGVGQFFVALCKGILLMAAVAAALSGGWYAIKHWVINLK